MLISSNLAIDLVRFIERTSINHLFEETNISTITAKPESGIAWEQVIELSKAVAAHFTSKREVDELALFFLSDESLFGQSTTRITMNIFNKKLLYEIVVNYVCRNQFPAVDFTADFGGDLFFINIKIPEKIDSPDFMLRVLKSYLEFLPTRIGCSASSVDLSVTERNYIYKIAPTSEKNAAKVLMRYFKDFFLKNRLIKELLHPETNYLRKYRELISTNSSLQETLGQRRVELRMANDRLVRKIAELEEIESISGSGTWTIDNEKKTVHLSSNAARIFGLEASTADITLSRFISCIHPEDRSEFEIAYSRLKGQSPNLYLELRVVTSEGHRVLQQRGKLEGSTVIGSIFDVTNLRKNEIRLAQERELALEASRNKSRFLASMSHEIRTPMTSVLGFAELIVNTKTSPEKLEAYVDTIIRNGRALLAIIDDILDLSKLEAGYLRFNIAEFESKSLIEDTLTNVKQIANEKNIKLSIQILDIPDAIQTDQLRFSQAISNILTQALKMAMPGDLHIEFRSAPNRSLGEGVEIIVRDQDHLISPEFFRILFNPFNSFEPEKQKKKSSVTLSLTLAKAMIAAMEGNIQPIAGRERSQNGFSIRLQPFSTANGNSAPTLAMPLLAMPLSLASSELAPNRSSLSQCKILITEDNKDIQEILAKTLQEAGAHTEIANNGIECLALMEKNEFDMILMDLQMPDMDGFEAIDRLREQGHTLPIIVVTAYALNDERERCIRAGCTDFVSKPVNGEVLIKTLVRNRA